MKGMNWAGYVAVVGAVAVGAYELGRRSVPAPQAVPVAGATASVSPAVSSTVQTALAKTEPLWKTAADSREHWEKRIQAVRALPDPLSDEDIGELLAFLHQVPAGDKNEWYLISNEIMEVLRKRNLAPGSFSRHMVGLIQDAEAEPVIRDYAAQSLAQWIAGLDPNLGHETVPARALETFDAMLGEVSKPDNRPHTLVGTTLHALADAVVNGSEPIRAKKDRLSEVALACASDAAASSVNRAAAIQVCARLELSEVSALCRSLLNEETTTADVRLSAIAALGQSGSAEDAVLLQRLAEDQRFTYAATAALSRLPAP